MTTLLVSAAINIAVGLLLTALFPPPDIEISGPRLNDLGFTSAAYGRFVNIVFGTDRVDGNIIDTPEPAIEEVVTVETTSAGKGGGQDVNTTSYTYFLTCRISWCIEGAADILRLWADGKTIGDITDVGPGLFGRLARKFVAPGVAGTFYPGGTTQLQDPEEVSRRDSNIPAYRHLTTLKLDRLPLANYGNRIPNFTAEIAFASTVSTPVLNMVEPTSSFELPGSLAGGDTTHMLFDPDRNRLYSLKELQFGTWAAEANTLTFKNFIGDTLTGLVNIDITVGRDGFLYRQTGTSNSGPLNKVDAETGALIDTFGTSGIGLTDDTTRFGNSGSWWQLQVSRPGAGVKSIVFHLNKFGNSNGSVVDTDLMPLSGSFLTPVPHVFSEDDGFPANIFTGFGIPDHDRGRFFIMTTNTANNTYDLHKVIPEFGATGVPGIGVTLSGVTISLVKQFTRGSQASGDDFEGTATVIGWAVNRANGDLMLSNNTSIVLYNPDSNTILAKKTHERMRGQNNYYKGSIFAYGINDTGGNGTIRVLDTRTLDIKNDIKTDDIPWPNSEIDGEIHEPSCVWDDTVGALFLSRVEGSSAAVNFRILKVFVNRVNAAGVGLDTVVSALSTSYQRQTMAGLDAADIDVTTLAGDTVFGYTINRISSMKQALQPLRDRFLFDGVQSDWIMKFPKRGAIPSVTIPAQDVGVLKRGRDQSDDPAIREVRLDDLSIPMSLAVRYRNKDADYQIDHDHDKRHIFPNPTMRSKSERVFDIPIADSPANMKPLIQKHLLTLWNERVSYKTIIPWTYIALDATDVFNMITFNETAQLRMAEMDVGLGWMIEITGVVEDTKSFTSTIGAGVGLGHIQQTVPASLPTRLFALDAPILSLQDFQIAALSNAYMAVGAYEVDWPGAAVMKSLDDVDYTVTGTVNSQAAIGNVISIPTHWGYIEGDFPNRFQSVADGGTMKIAATQRSDAWANAADETAVLAGANTAAVIHRDTGEVEIFGFETAVVQPDLSILLSNLIRGRLGTEDIADKDIDIGDTVILLSGSTNVKESSPIIRQRFGLTDLDKEFFFKGVTVGTLIEDAPKISATYTGRDLKPFSVVHTTAVNTAGDIVVDWERRTRGPLAGEWLDGTGEIVLNESIEKYEVVITDGSANTFTKTVNDATILTFLAAEITALSGASTVTVIQESGTGKKSPITPSSTATVTV